MINLEVAFFGSSVSSRAKRGSSSTSFSGSSPFCLSLAPGDGKERTLGTRLRVYMREYKGDVIIEVMSGTLSAVKVMPDMLNYPSYTSIDGLFSQTT